jgi:hypothetical protein
LFSRRNAYASAETAMLDVDATIAVAHGEKANAAASHTG